MDQGSEDERVADLRLLMKLLQPVEVVKADANRAGDPVLLAMVADSYAITICQLKKAPFKVPDDIIQGLQDRFDAVMEVMQHNGMLDFLVAQVAQKTGVQA